MIEVPTLVRNKATLAGATDWLDQLPDLIASLEVDWEIEVGRAFQDGTEALVAEATLGSGRAAVLKLMVPRPGNAARDEITVLRLAGGDGCAELLRSDENRGALLVERLGPSLHDLGYPLAVRLEILVATAARVWRHAPDAGLRTGAEKGAWLCDFITTQWDELDRPCSEQAVDYALECARCRVAAHDDERAVLVHGDVHEWNALQSGGGFKLVDPDGLLAEAEYDLGVLMREDPVDLLDGDPYERATLLAGMTGLDPVAIWEWGVVERVSTGFVCTSIDLQPVGRQMLEVAERVAATLG